MQTFAPQAILTQFGAYIIPAVVGLGVWLVLDGLGSLLYVPLVNGVFAVKRLITRMSKDEASTQAKSFLYESKVPRSTSFFIFVFLGIVLALFSLPNVPLGAMLALGFYVIGMGLDDSRVNYQIQRKQHSMEVINLFAILLASTSSYKATIDSQQLLQTAEEHGETEFVLAVDNAKQLADKHATADAIQLAFSQTLWYREIANSIARSGSDGVVAVAEDLRRYVEIQRTLVLPAYEKIRAPYGSIRFTIYMMVVVLSVFMLIAMMPFLQMSYTGDSNGIPGMSSILSSTLGDVTKWKESGNPVRDYYVYIPGKGALLLGIVWGYAILTYAASKYSMAFMESA